MNKEVFINHPTIQASEYTLKAVEKRDLRELEELCSYYPPNRRKKAQEPLDIIEKSYKDHTGINCGIYLHSELIGTVCFFYRGFENNEGELEYVIRAQFRKKGIGTTCAIALLDVTFNQMNLNTVEAYTGIENTASQKLLFSSGFQRINHEDPKTAAFRIEGKNGI